MASQNLEIQTLRSQIGDLTDFLAHSGHDSSLSPSDSHQILQDFVLDFQEKAKRITEDHADIVNFSNEDLDAYMDRLRAELMVTETESASISQELDSLAKSYVEGTCQLASNLEAMRHVVNFAESKGYRQSEAGEEVRKHSESEAFRKLAKAQNKDSFEILNLKHQIEMNEAKLKSFRDLDLAMTRLEAIEMIKEAFTGLKVIDVEENILRVSLTTYVPDVEGFTPTKLSEVNHELVIEVLDDTTEIKNAEIFPNDVYIGEIVEAAHNYSKLFRKLQETRSGLGWFLQKVQDKIVLCTLRRHFMKIANNSRHSFEYLDKDESIIAHMTGGIDAYLKPSQGWPLSGSGLKLVSLRSTDQNAKEISLNLLSKVEEVVNSLDFDTQKGITNFVDRIEESLLEKMRPELH